AALHPPAARRLAQDRDPAPRGRRLLADAVARGRGPRRRARAAHAQGRRREAGRRARRRGRPRHAHGATSVSPAVVTRPLALLGLEVRAPEGTAWEAFDPAQIHAWVGEHRVVVLRGLAPFDKPGLPVAARRLGPLQAWSFGSVNELKPDPDTKNYLYTNRA